MTPLKDARLIVPTDALWVSVCLELWEPHFADMDWNSMLMSHDVKLPADVVKIGVFEDVFRRHKVCRPLEEFKNFSNQGLYIIK